MTPRAHSSLRRRGVRFAALAAVAVASVLVPATPATTAGAQPGNPPSSNGPGLVPSFVSSNCTAFDANGWGYCTVQNNGALPFYQWNGSPLPASILTGFSSGFPHGSFHAPSTWIAGFGIHQQGDRLGKNVYTNETYLTWRAPSNTGISCLNNMKFFLTPFYTGAVVNTGFPGAWSMAGSGSMAPRYNSIPPGSGGAGTQFAFGPNQPNNATYAFLRSQSTACG